MTPTTSNVWNPGVTCNTTGELTVTVSSTYYYMGSPYYATKEFKAYVVGGDIKLTTDRTKDPKREFQDAPGIPATKLQPFFMEYYGKKKSDPAVPGLAKYTTITAEPPTFTQPAGCTTHWEHGGPIELTTDGANVKATPTGTSSDRGDAIIRMKFKMTVDGVNYEYLDCSDSRNSRTTTPDQGYRQITVHKPVTIVETPLPELYPVDNETPIPGGGFIWEMERPFSAEVRSQLGDPVAGIEVQERFTSITRNPSTIPELALTAYDGWNTPDTRIVTVDGAVYPPHLYNQFGYHANVWDFFSYTLPVAQSNMAAWNMPRHFYNADGTTPSGKQPFQTMHQEYYAGTKVSTIGGPGILLGKFKIEMWTDRIVRTAVED